MFKNTLLLIVCAIAMIVSIIIGAENPQTIIPAKNRFVVQNATPEDNSYIFIFTITDTQTSSEYLFIRSAGNAGSLLKIK